MSKLRVFECFAGVGSQRMALRNLGVDHEVVGIAEIDKFALKSYKAIHGDCPNYGDISLISPCELPDMDLFTYSFPCQDLSVSGRQQGLGKGTRSGLLYECQKVIETKRPKYLLLENVKNLVGTKFKAQFQEWLDYLEGLGYTNHWEVLNAKNFGLPQNRERVFVVSILGNQPFEFDLGTPTSLKLSNILEEEIDSKYYVSDKIQSRLQILKEDDGATNVVGTTAPECRTIGQRDLVYGINGIMGTLMASNYKQPKQIMWKGKVRKLTPLECWRLMSFTDEDFYKAKNAGVSDSQLYKQAGNSIVVKVLEGIFTNMFIDTEYDFRKNS